VHRHSGPIRLYRRNDLVIEFEILDKAGDPYDVTDADRIEFVVMWNNQVLFMKDLNDGVVIVDGPAGHVDVSVSSVDSDISAGVYRFELLVTDLMGNRLVADQEAFVVDQSLTYAVT
jgi:hypothetical protein